MGQPWDIKRTRDENTRWQRIRKLVRHSRKLETALAKGLAEGYTEAEIRLAVAQKLFYAERWRHRQWGCE